MKQINCKMLRSPTWPIVMAVLLLGLFVGCDRESPGDQNNNGDTNQNTNLNSNANENLNNANDNLNTNQTGYCGDGIVDLGEACDGDNLQDQDCAALGFTKGELSCTEICSLYTTACSLCGDGIAEGLSPEEAQYEPCDGLDLRGQDCADHGFTKGELSCTLSCGLDTSYCSLCGNNVAEGASPQEAQYEVCDGQDLRGQDCASLHQGQGTLGCTTSCQWDLQGCTGGTVIYVDCDPTIAVRDGLSWSTALATVQEGIDAAYALGAGSEVWVAACTYYIYQSAPTDHIRLRSGVAVYGGFAGTESVRTQRDWVANPTILNGTNGSAARVLSVVTGNDNAEINGFIITEGGSGMSNMYDSPVVANCAFIGNNADRGGGMYNYESSPVITNCLFIDNTATWGGGMYNTNSSPVVTNCTFAGNVATWGGGMDNSDSTSQVTNSVIWGNTATFGDSIHDYNSSPVVTFSNIEGGYSGTGNIDQTPQFVGGGDYHLQAGSPCIDRGDDSAAPATDLDGNPRVDIAGVGTTGTLADMGAYEYQP